MRRLIAACLIAAGLATALWAQQPVSIYSGGSPVPLATTTEVAHGAALGTLTNVKSLMLMCRSFSGTPTALGSDDQGVLVYCDRSGALNVHVVDVAGAVQTVPAAATSGGCTPAKLISAATTNATSVKASAGTIYSITVGNTNAAARYLKFYNKASAPTVGTDVPVQVFTIPPSGQAGPPITFPVGAYYSTGIAFATTTGSADTDTAAVALGEVTVNYCWK